MGLAPAGTSFALYRKQILFVEIDQESGLPASEDNSQCVHSVAEMESRGFRVIEATRTIPCTEIHFTAPFHIRFTDGHTIAAEAVASDYAGIQSSHRVVLVGHIPHPGDKVAFEAIAG